MKKMISIFLSALMIFGIPFYTYAQDEELSGSTGETGEKYTYIFENGTEITSENAPENTENKYTSLGDSTHSVTVYKWEQDEENTNVFKEVIDEDKSVKSESCDFEVQEERVDATCTSAGKTEVKKCKYCGYETGGDEIPQLSHEISYSIVKESTCDEWGEMKGTCDNCDYTFTYKIAPHSYSDWKETQEPTCSEEGIKERACLVCGEKETVKLETIPHTPCKQPVVENKKEATCSSNEQFDSVVYCTVCHHEISRATETTENSINSSNHKWSTTSTECELCNTKDDIEEIKSVTCNKTDYFIGDPWDSTITMEVQCKNHSANITTEENLFTDFSTDTTGTKNWTLTYEKETYSVPISFTVTKPKLTMTFIENGKTWYVWNDDIYSLGDKGMQFTVSTNCSDNDKIGLKYNSNYLSVSKSKQKDGTYLITIKPKQYYKATDSNYKNYYVTAYFERNSTEYSITSYYNCNINALKCNTASAVYTQGASAKPTLSFTQTYIDGTTSKLSVTKTLSTSSVGVKKYTYSYYGKSASYTYYVRCKTPTLKVKSQKKAVSLSWNKVSGATGYKIYRATSKNGTYKLIKTISSGSTTSYKNTKLTSKKTYYYKITAIYSKNSKCNSKQSSAKSCKAG
ncbi:MAG: hypothetical protein ACI4IE_01065 [Eubacterium sp.]